MRTYDLNGKTRPISLAELSDEDIASKLDGLSRRCVLHVAARDRIMCLAKEKAELSSELEYTRYWYGCRFERLNDLMRSEATPELCHRYFDIVANGTAESHEPPTYQQQVNTLKHRNEALSEQRDELLGALNRLVDHHDSMCSGNEGGDCNAGNEARDIVSKYAEKRGGGN